MTRYQAYYPVIFKAGLLIAYDNGLVNRDMSEDRAITIIETIVKLASFVDVNLIHKELSLLSDEDLNTLCCGEHGAVKVSKLAHEFLNTIFWTL